MKILSVRIKEQAKIKNVQQYVIEKDYALSYVLAGIAANKDLHPYLIFKGGTALKKNFFGEYRFSEDLDFSAINSPKEDKLEIALLNSMKVSSELLNQYGLAFDIKLKRYSERDPHPNGQEAFNVFVKFPWQREATRCRIKIEITHDEPVILAPEKRLILHGYDEDLNASILCYPIEEIVAEKLRALLQTQQKLVMRGWSGPRVRDYYDLWRILKHYDNHLNKEKLITTLDKKCEHRSVSYKSIDDFFTPELEKAAQQHWHNSLGVLIPGLPVCIDVLNETKLLVLKTIFEG